MREWRAWLLGVLLCGGSVLGEDALTLETGDGLALELTPEGVVGAVTIDGVRLPTGEGGVYLKDMSLQAEPERMNVYSRAYRGVLARGRAQRTSDREVQVLADLAGEQLTVRATYRAESGYIRLDAEVTNTADEERAIIAYVRLPLDLVGARWWKDLHQSETIDATTRYLNPYYTHQGYRPCASESVFTAVTDIPAEGTSAGLSLVLPMDTPRYFRTTYERGFGYQVEVELGLSPLTHKFPNRAGFSVLLYRVDPRWGLRSAVERYYQFFPDLFSRRCARGGTWFLEDVLEKELRDPEDFALVFKETYQWANADTRRHGMLAMKYMEPWCDHYCGTEEWLRRQAQDLPANNLWAPSGKSQPIRVQAQALLISGVRLPDGFLYGPNHPDFRSQRQGDLAKAYGKHWPQVKQVLGTDETQAWGCRYPTNPDVELPGMCRGKSVLAYEVLNQWGRKPTSPQDVYDGIYYDSTAGWWTGWHLNNFNREHFPYADFPLVFDHGTGQVALLHGLSCMEFLKYLSDEVHGKGQLTMSNSGPGLFINFAAPYLDMIGAGEGYRRGDHKGLWLLRTVAHTKPMSFLNNADITEADFHHCLAFAVYPGGPRGVENWNRLRPLYRKYIPLLNRLDRAGWQPVPCAQAEPEGLLVERFGPQESGTFLLVVHNLGESQAEGTVTLLSDELAQRIPGWTGSVVIKELLSGRPLSPASPEEPSRFAVALAPEESWVLEVRPVTPTNPEPAPAQLELGPL